MVKIGVRELRQHASRHLERGKAGVSLEVTERGRLIAVLVAPGEPRSARDGLVPAVSPAPASHPFALPRPLPERAGLPKPTSQATVVEVVRVCHRMDAGRDPAAIQLATALTVEETLVAHDDRLLEAARAQGLPSITPA